MGNTIPTARARARAEVSAEILAEARRQLAVAGASSLSLRAVTRELGMASSAAYRYFPSRDDLLTALIVEAYDSLGEAAERAADSTADSGGSPFERWQTVCRAIRGWAIDNPHEYALIYGSPVPGYRAPVLTVGPASRVTLALAGLVSDAQRAGTLAPVAGPPLAPAMVDQVEGVRQLAMEDVPPDTIARALVAWTQLFGQISFEVFGQLQGIVENADVVFEHAIAVMGGVVGLRH
jgi:AcrR family transcriptional regulator